MPKGRADDALDEAERELCELAEGIDLEELVMRAEEECDDDSDIDKNSDGWVDERELLSAADRAELDASVRPA